MNPPPDSKVYGGKIFPLGSLCLRAFPIEGIYPIYIYKKIRQANKQKRTTNTFNQMLFQKQFLHPERFLMICFCVEIIMNNNLKKCLVRFKAFVIE